MPVYKIFEMDKVREDASPEAEIQRVKGDLMKAGIVVYQKNKVRLRTPTPTTSNSTLSWRGGE